MALLEEAVMLPPETLPTDAASTISRRPSFTFISTDVLEPLPGRNYFVDSLLPEGSIVVVGGYGGSAKTWLATSWAMAMATGTPWLGRFATTKMPTALFDFEAGEYESRRRIRAIHAGLNTKERPNIALCVHPGHSLNSPEFPIALEDVLVERRFAVIDSLRAATSGLDENDSNIRRSIDELRRVPGADRACIVLLAHARKGGGEAREQLRGSGAIFDAADQVFFLKAEEDATFSVAQTKNRFGRPNEPFKFTLEDGRNGSVRLVEAHSTKGKATSVEPALLKQVVKAVAANPGITVSRLRELIKARASRVDEAAAALQEMGAITRGGSKGFSLVSTKAGE